MNTALKDRILWYNGISEVNESDIPLLCVKHNKIPSSFIISNQTKDSLLYNELYPLDKIKQSNPEMVFDIKYSLLNTDYDLFDVALKEFFDNHVNNLSSTDIKTRYDRLEAEFDLIHEYRLESYIKSVYEVTKRLQQQNIVWAGRGSSCACYTLYILGIHNIDSVKYDIPYTEFFR